MVEAVVYALLIGFPLLGVFVRRWFVLVLPAIAWPLFYAGVHQGWWLDGTGDGWQTIRTALAVTGVATTALAVSLGRALTRRPSVRRFVKAQH